MTPGAETCKAKSSLMKCHGKNPYIISFKINAWQ